MAIKVLKEVNRHPGYTPSGTILPGQVVMKVTDGETIKAYDGTTLDVQPLGFAIDSTVQFPASAGVYGAVGAGYNYPEFNRGGLVAVFTDGGLFEFSNDGRGSPLTITDTWTLNAKVYIGASGLMTCSTMTVGTDPVVGIVEAVSGSGATLKVTIKALI